MEEKFKRFVNGGCQVAKLLVSEQGNSIVGQTIYMSGGKGIIDKGQ